MEKGFRSFGFTELRNIAVPEEMGRIEQSKYDSNHMEASGEQTKKFLYKLKRRLNNTKAELLKRQETQLHFTKAPENERQIYERFVGISSIIRQRDGSMYIFFFHAHHDAADSLLKYIMYDLYETSSKWVLNTKEASEWWEKKGFTQDNNYTIIINKEK